MDRKIKAIDSVQKEFEFLCSQNTSQIKKLKEYTSSSLGKLQRILGMCWNW